MSSDSKNNGDVKQHLLKIEERLERLSVSPQLSFDSLPSRRNDEIDLREIWNILWDGKWWIIGVTFLFAVGSVILAFSLPNQYKAEVILAPAQEQAGGLAGLASQYGGLAAMAGINIGGKQSSDVDQAITLVKSWPFLDAIVDKYNLKPEIMAVKEWDSINDKIIYDEDIYNFQTKQWVQEPKSNRPSEPTSYDVYRSFSEMISVSRDPKSGLINLSVEHRVPKMSHEWVKLLVQELNNHFQYRDTQDAARNIEYLKTKIQETSIAEMQLVFYRMVEAQMKTLMLAEVSGEYLVRTVVAPSVPERTSQPKRAMICIIAVLLGGVLSLVLIVILRFTRDNNAKVA
jgi:uncharacterized protein involved in exopolysaccharide biosynthesis